MFLLSMPNFFPAISFVQLGSPTFRDAGSFAIESRYPWTIDVTALSTSSTWVLDSRLASSFGGSGSGRTHRWPSARPGPVIPTGCRRGAGDAPPVSTTTGRRWGTGAGAMATVCGSVRSTGRVERSDESPVPSRPDARGSR